MDDIWGDARPVSGTGPLRTYIWELRRLLNPVGNGAERSVLISRDAGYLLDVERDQIDSGRFEAAFTAAQTAGASGHVDGALTSLKEALGLWHGPAFGDLAEESAVRAEALRLEQVFLEAKELHAELMLTAGHDAEVVADLDEVVRSHPERERLWGMLMIALYRSGRQREALRCFQEARATLVEETGLEPGPDLHQLEQAILHHEPVLGGPRWAGSWLGGDSLAFDDSPGARPGVTPSAVREAMPARHNLPRPMSTLVGRSSERVAVTELLKTTRLVTLTGSGGCGKTRLALAVAEDVLSWFPGGVWFVDLSTDSDVDLVVSTLVRALDVEGSPTDWVGPVSRRIGADPALLVLDNCEHLVAAVAEVVDQLLVHSRSACILATSREELRVEAETVWRVPGLSVVPTGVPDPGVSPLDSEAVELFVERGRSVLPGFAPTGEALEAIAQICSRLDGTPLAIELAAALVGSLPVAEIAARLDDSVGLLTVGRRSGVPRHQTLQAALEWSYELLDEPAQQLFVKLSVFGGSFDLAAAEAVIGTPTGADFGAVARGVGHLARTSLLECLSSDDGAKRYRMQETVRQYARSRLEMRDDAAVIYRRHASYFAELVAMAEPYAPGPAMAMRLDRIAIEFPNLRAAAAWAFSHDEREIGLRLADGLYPFFARMVLVDEVAGWLDVSLELMDQLSPHLQVKALTAAANVAITRGELSRARQLSEEGITLARELDDARELGMALMVCGAAAVWARDLSRAEECFTEADALWTRLRNPWPRAWMLANWAQGVHDAGQTERAKHRMQEALDIFRDLEDVHGQVFPLVHLARFSLEAGDVKEAEALAGEAVEIAVSVEGRELQHVAFSMLGAVEVAAGRMRQGRDLLVQSIRDFPGSRNWVIVARVLENLVGLSMLAGEHDAAAVVLGVVRQVRERWGISSADRLAELVVKWQEALVEILGTERFERQLRRGQLLELEVAIQLAEKATAGVGSAS